MRDFRPFLQAQTPRLRLADHLCGFLEQKKMRGRVGRILLYRGIVARCDSMSETRDAHVNCGGDRRFSWGPR